MVIWYWWEEFVLLCDIGVCSHLIFVGGVRVVM